MTVEQINELQPILDMLALTKIKMQQLHMKMWAGANNPMIELSNQYRNLTDELVEKLIEMKLITIRFGIG